MKRSKSLCIINLENYLSQNSPTDSGDEAKILVFPKNSNKVRRSVILSLDEFSNRIFEVFVENQPASMDAALFTLIPYEGSEDDYVAELNREILRWGDDTDWRRVGVFIDRRGDNQESIVKMVLHDKRGRTTEYLYQVTSDENVLPVSALTY